MRKIKGDIPWLSKTNLDELFIQLIASYYVLLCIFLQLKFTMIVCYLSTHINVVILTASIFSCNAFIFVIWSRLMSTSRKAKQKYSNPNYDENENDNW